MSSVAQNRRRMLAATAGLAATALVLTACSGSSDDGDSTADSGSSGGPITIGTTDKIVTIDPAGSYDNGSLAVQTQVFEFLMNSPYGSSDGGPDAAEAAEFTSPTDYTVKLKPGLTFANGHELTASDVKFTFDRQLKIAAPDGPSSLLYNLGTTDAVDDTTVVFHLKAADDQVFPQILSSFPGAIV